MLTQREKWRAYKATQRLYPLEGVTCEVVGCNRPAEHRHHVDNDTLNINPENVLRLCAAHHRIMHPGILTYAQIRDIRDSDASSNVLGERYGISASYARNIRNGWRLRQ
jgi:hypothetical protein